MVERARRADRGRGMHGDGRARRAPARSRAPARCDRTAPSAIGRCGRRAPRAAAARSTSARRARSASRCVRSRSRAMAWRCACALASFEAFSRASSPAIALAAAAQQRARRHASAARRDTVSRCRACATWPRSTRKVSRALDAAKRRKCACVLAFRPRGRAPPRASSRCRGIASSSLGRGQRARGGAQLVAAAFLAALPADAWCGAPGSRPRPSVRCAPAPPFRPPRSASARACRRRNRSA